MVLADAVWPTTGSAFNGSSSDWTRTPDPNNPNDPAHFCLIHRVAFAQDPSVAYDYGTVPCNSAPTSWDGKTRHSGGANITFADGHSKFRKSSAITNDLYAGTQSGG